MGFASELADILYKQAHKGRFDKIILVAPPNTLGELRHEMHKEVADKVVGEIPKTLTNHPIEEIEAGARPRGRAGVRLANGPRGCHWRSTSRKLGSNRLG